jgi:hypothetical protein
METDARLREALERHVRGEFRAAGVMQKEEKR